jgi:hypothetical protein
LASCVSAHTASASHVAALMLLLCLPSKPIQEGVAVAQRRDNVPANSPRTPCCCP